MIAKVLAVRNRAVVELNMMMQRHRHLQNVQAPPRALCSIGNFLTRSSFSSLSSKSLSIDSLSIHTHFSTPIHTNNTSTCLAPWLLPHLVNFWLDSRSPSTAHQPTPSTSLASPTALPTSSRLTTTETLSRRRSAPWPRTFPVILPILVGTRLT